jgi:hypothetical protein
VIAGACDFLAAEERTMDAEELPGPGVLICLLVLVPVLPRFPPRLAGHRVQRETSAGDPLQGRRAMRGIGGRGRPRMERDQETKVTREGYQRRGDHPRVLAVGTRRDQRRGESCLLERQSDLREV